MICFLCHASLIFISYASPLLPVLDFEIQNCDVENLENYVGDDDRRLPGEDAVDDPQHRPDVEKYVRREREIPRLFRFDDFDDLRQRGYDNKCAGNESEDLDKHTDVLYIRFSDQVASNKCPKIWYNMWCA